LYLSGVVHDLGKIEVPAEILSKPSRLHPVEFALVKRHPEVGYHILKNIDFPGPLPTSSASTTNIWMAPAIRWACRAKASCWSRAS
jgi:HD-GYP domain-containing protein (c-di-GMP phosphodiesterase class II)